MTGGVETFEGRLHGAVPVLIGVAGLCGFLAVTVGTGRYGAGVTPDSVTYAWAARGLLSGRGMELVYGGPYTMWGPLYPWLLAALGLTGVDLYVAGRVLNAVLFAGIVILPGLWLLRDSRRPGLTLFVTLMALTSATMVWAATVLSEPLFIMLVLLALWRMRDFVTRPSTTSLVVGALLAGAACLTRYIGVSVIVTGCLLLLAAREGPRYRRIRNSAIFGGIALLPLVLWLARNRIVTGSLAGVRRPATAGVLDNVASLGHVLGGTLMPSGLAARIPGVAWALGALLLVAGTVTAAVVHRRRRGCDLHPPHLLPPVVFCIVYAAFLVTLSSVYMTDPIGFRLSSPLFIPLLLVLAWSLDELLTPTAVTGTPAAGSRRRRLPRVLRTVAGVVLVLMGLARVSVWMVKWLRDGAGGYNTRSWHESGLIAWLRTHPFDGPVYSNDVYALAFLTGNPGQVAPQTPIDGSAAADVSAEIRRQLPAAGEARLVWFDTETLDVFYTPGQMTHCADVQPVVKFPHGTVYLLHLGEDAVRASPAAPTER